MAKVKEKRSTKQKKTTRYNKFISLFAIVIFILILLIGRLVKIQFIDGEEHRENAARQQTSNKVINPDRGTIYDANGKTLATSEKVDTVTVNPSYIDNNDKEKIADAFVGIFGLEKEKVLNKLNSKSSVVTIVEKVEQNKIDELKNWMKTNKITQGINIDNDVKRYYPYNNLASNLIGFCNVDNQGSEGIEAEWNEVLTGVSGKRISSTNAISKYIPDKNETYYAAQNGSNITLTIDANIQTIVEKYLKQACIENNPKNGGTCIIMKPSTGDILAMATYPDYNLNDPRVPTEYYADGFAELDETEQYNRLFKMWRNKCVQDTYEPGSTYKIITASIALEEGAYDTDTPGVFYCPGYQQINSESRIWCWKTSGAHASESLREALMNSCNPAMMQISQYLGAKTEYRYYKAFGLMDETGIQTSGEADSTYWDLEDCGVNEQATMSFGQRFTITPIQLITAISCVANKGVLVQPKIVKSITNPDTGTVTAIDTKEVRQVISKETSEKMIDMLTSVVSDGTGKYGQVPGYTTAGKTGTSEPDPGHPENGFVVSFVSIAPASNPELVCLVALYGVDDSASGGGTAGPVVSQILSEVLPYLGIPSEDVTSNDTEGIETKAVPDIKDKTVAEANSILSAAGLEPILGDAKLEDIVVDQVPKPGISVPLGGQIRIYTKATTGARVRVGVPNLKGMGYSDALETLAGIGLNLSVSGNADGIVITQDPIAGTEVECGSIVYATMHQQSADTH